MKKSGFCQIPWKIKHFSSDRIYIKNYYFSPAITSKIYVSLIGPNWLIKCDLIQNDLLSKQVTSVSIYRRQPETNVLSHLLLRCRISLCNTRNRFTQDKRPGDWKIIDNLQTHDWYQRKTFCECRWKYFHNWACPFKPTGTHLFWLPKTQRYPFKIWHLWHLLETCLRLTRHFAAVIANISLLTVLCNIDFGHFKPILE